MEEVLNAQIKLAPDMFKAENDPLYGRKAYARLEQDIMWEKLLGFGGQQGGASDPGGGSQWGVDPEEARAKFDIISGDWNKKNDELQAALKEAEGRDVFGDFVGRSRRENDLARLKGEISVHEQSNPTGHTAVDYMASLNNDWAKGTEWESYSAEAESEARAKGLEELGSTVSYDSKSQWNSAKSYNTLLQQKDKWEGDWGQNWKRADADQKAGWTYYDPLTGSKLQGDSAMATYEKFLNDKAAEYQQGKDTLLQGYSGRASDYNTARNAWLDTELSGGAGTGTGIGTGAGGEAAPGYAGGGLVDMYAGDQMKKFATGLVDESGNPIMEARRAGFDAAGKFQGLDTLGKDLQSDAARRQRGEDINAVSEFGEKATELYRDQGDIRERLKEATDLGQQSSIPASPVDERHNQLIQLANSQSYDKVGSPLSPVDPLAGRQRRSPATDMFGPPAPGIGDFMQRQIDDPSGVDDTGGNPAWPPASQIPQQQLAAGIDRVAAPGRARDTQFFGGIQDVDASQVDSRDINAGTVNAQGIGNMAGLRSGLVQGANADLALGGDLSMRERRALEQASRGASSVRGRGRDFGAVVDEVGAIEGARRQREMERKQFASGIAGQEGQFRTAEMRDSLQGALANQASYLQKDLANQRSALQAAQGNQQVGLQSQMANQQADISGRQQQIAATQANQQADLQAGQMGLQASLANQGTQMGLGQMDIQAQMANQQARQAQDRMRMGALEKDIDRGIATSELNERLRQSGLGADRGYATQLVGLEQATSADPFTAVLNRPSGAGVQTGQQLYGNAGGGAAAGPALYNPQSGLGFIGDQQNINANYQISREANNTAMDTAWLGFGGNVFSSGLKALA